MYFNRVNLSHLSSKTWQSGQNALLIDYQKYQATGREPSVTRRSWTLLGNLTATAGWGVLALPAAAVTLLTFGKWKNAAWQHACAQAPMPKRPSMR